jgi:hypothetical protein
MESASENSRAELELFDKSLKDDLAALAQEITAEIIPPREIKRCLVAPYFWVMQHA